MTDTQTAQEASKTKRASSLLSDASNVYSMGDKYSWWLMKLKNWDSRFDNPADYG